MLNEIIKKNIQETENEQRNKQVEFNVNFLSL